MAPPCLEAEPTVRRPLPESTEIPPVAELSRARCAETILVVEDEDGIRSLVRAILEMNGYSVVVASGGAEAIQLAQEFEGSLSLLITDVVMPDIGGRVVAQTLQAARPGLRVLFVSGYTSDSVLREGVEDASVAFLQKPFSVADLVGQVRAVLDGR